MMSLPGRRWWNLLKGWGNRYTLKGCLSGGQTGATRYVLRNRIASYYENGKQWLKRATQPQPIDD